MLLKFQLNITWLVSVCLLLLLLRVPLKGTIVFHNGLMDMDLYDLETCVVDVSTQRLMSETFIRLQKEVERE